MSASHHGPEREPEEEQRRRELMSRFLEQVEGKAKRIYSAGRVSADDDGDLALAVAADKEKKIVIIRFGKPVEWIGLGPKEVNGLINMLTEKLRQLGEPVAIKIG